MPPVDSTSHSSNKVGKAAIHLNANLLLLASLTEPVAAWPVLEPEIDTFFCCFGWKPYRGVFPATLLSAELLSPEEKLKIYRRSVASGNQSTMNANECLFLWVPLFVGFNGKPQPMFFLGGSPRKGRPNGW